MNGFAWFFSMKENNLVYVDKVRSDDCFTSPLAKLRDRCLTFELFIFQKAHFWQSKIYMGLLTTPWKVNKSVATLSPCQLCPPAKPTHHQPRCGCVLGRWGTNRALMEFEENIMYYPRHEVAALSTQHQMPGLWCAQEHPTAPRARTLLMQRQTLMN